MTSGNGEVGFEPRESEGCPPLLHHHVTQPRWTMDRTCGRKYINAIRERHSITFSVPKNWICNLKLLTLNHGLFQPRLKERVKSNLKWEKLPERTITQIFFKRSFIILGQNTSHLTHAEHSKKKLCYLFSRQIPMMTDAFSYWMGITLRTLQNLVNSTSCCWAIS